MILRWQYLWNHCSLVSHLHSIQSLQQDLEVSNKTPKQSRKHYQYVSNSDPPPSATIKDIHGSILFLS